MNSAPSPSAEATSAPAAPPPGVVLLIDGYANPHAGTEGQLRLLLQGLSDRRVPCHVLVLSPTHGLAEAGCPAPWTVVGHTALSSPRTWLEVLRALRSLRRRGFRIVHTFFNDASVLGPPLARLLGMAVLVSRRDVGYWISPGYRRLLRLTGRCVDLCVANSEAVADRTRRIERLPAQRLRVVPNGVPRAGATPGASTIPEAPLRPGPDTLVVGIVANVRPVKRVEDLVDVLARLRAGGADVLAVVVGGGDLDALAARAAALGIRDRVHLAGSRPDARAWLAHFDVGVLCSESEGLSNTLIEYQLAGLPTVCSDTGGNPEIVEDQVTGLLYPPGDLDALERQLWRLLRDPALRTRLGHAARLRAEGRFDPDRMVERYLELYRALASGRELEP